MYAVWASARVVVPVCETRFLHVILQALEPEVRAHVTPRSRVSLTENDGAVVLLVRANDTVALRASINAYLRWIRTVLGVLQVVRNS